jgi:hypothetical protein
MDTGSKIIRREQVTVTSVCTMTNNNGNGQTLTETVYYCYIFTICFIRRMWVPERRGFKFRHRDDASCSSKVGHTRKIGRSDDCLENKSGRLNSMIIF